MSKQVLIDNKWYDVSYIQKDGPTNRFLVVYQDDGKPRALCVNSGWLRDKPAEPINKNEIDWEKPLQIKHDEKWYDVIFYKIYNIEVLKDGYCDTRIALIYEMDDKPAYAQDVLSELFIRNKPSILTFERWLVHSRDGVVHTCHTEVEAQKRLLHFKNGGHFIKHIKVEWEL